jgi:hypothetical protein
MRFAIGAVATSAAARSVLRIQAEALDDSECWRTPRFHPPPLWPTNRSAHGVSLPSLWRVACGTKEAIAARREGELSLDGCPKGETTWDDTRKRMRPSGMRIVR